ncbi:DNA-formamidopyrimidine glycosylase family protein [Christensenella tenuis]|uniref:DNA-formamidopyrimidine glycosylase n=1 Tax=Christensenella tenuis TaxID=2763033 RepID=A0ABR7EAK7_9FIRM|nr:DNA-formamidopyrimidine glycosylase [Christensenella tenuis]
MVAHLIADLFCRRLARQTFDSVVRRGKLLVIMLKSGDRIIIHLRMTGCLLLAPAEYPEEKHRHIVFSLNNGKELRFSDTRRFGRFWLLDKDETNTYSGIEKLGKEPFDSDFTAEYLSTKLGGRKKVIKECLMEQNTIAGIGNIYSDEILFAARIYPGRPANSLTGENGNVLPQSFQSVLPFSFRKIARPQKNILKQRERSTAIRHIYRFTGVRGNLALLVEPLCHI